MIMSKHAFSPRKSIKPLADIDDNEDDKRRDLFGRKRVDVIQCLLESSSDDSNDESNFIHQTSLSLLWLTFAEICHIRTVLAQTTLNTLMVTKDKQYPTIVHGDVCFRCRKVIHSFFTLPSIFFFSANSFICSVCQQRFCKRCSIFNFLLPLLKQSFPVRLQTLIKTTSTIIATEMNKENQFDQQRKTICFDCAQIFNEHRKPSYSHSPVHTSSDQIEKTTITNTSFITRF